MQTTDDQVLLRQYAETGSEDAFSELLRRHVNLVYSAAMRRVGNPEQAEEITQAVFVILARKARGLSQKVILSGWLYRAASLAAASSIRADARRKRREEEAMMQPTSADNETDAWVQIAPMLDGAMDRLSRSDREAIVMRFFEGKSMQAVGDACGISENAAKKRVYRGLEALRKFFSKRGLVVTGAIIAGAITSNSVQAAPADLATKIGLAAVKGGAVKASAAALVASTLKLMLWENLKLVLAYGLPALLVIGAGVPIVSNVLAHSNVSTVLADSNASHVVAGSDVSHAVAGSNEPKTPVVHLVGTMTEFQMDENGTVTATNYGGELLSHESFELWRRNSQWAVRLIGDTNLNLPGLVSEVACDGTDIYVYVPGIKGGTHGIGTNIVLFQNTGSIYPGTIKCFRMFMAPLWWGYCSSLAQAGNGPIPDFINAWRTENPAKEMPTRSAFLRVAATKTDGRMGPSEMTLYGELGSGQFSSDPYCDILPMATMNVGDLTVVTRFQMRRYREVPEHTDAKPRVLESFDVAVDKANLETNAMSFVPQLDGPTLINDYRSAWFREGYVSDHWIDPGKTNLQSPVPGWRRSPGNNSGSEIGSDNDQYQPHLVGKRAPEFQAQTISGQTVHFPADYKGKLVLLDFWATWCGPCVAESPNVSAAYGQFGSRGVEFLGVSLDKNNAVDQIQVDAFCKAHNMSWPEIYDGKELDAEIAKLYSIKLIPMSLLVDGDTGMVLLEGDSLRGKKLAPALEQALKKKVK